MNYQNIPAGLKVVRKAFIPKTIADYVRDGGQPNFFDGERGVISSFDLSKIEPRLLAYFASKKGDDTLAGYLRKGRDPYKAVVSEVFRKPEHELTEAEYKRGKILFLSLMYGGGVKTIQNQFGIPRAEAKAMIEQFHSAWPIVRVLQDDVLRVARKRGYIKTPWGRRLHLEEFGEHKLLNKLIQGSAAHLLKRALIRIDDWLEEHPELASHMILNVHDEIDFDGPADEVEVLHEHVPALMSEPVVAEVVPILVDHEVSPDNWAEKLDYTDWRNAA